MDDLLEKLFEDDSGPDYFCLGPLEKKRNLLEEYIMEPIRNLYRRFIDYANW